METIFECLVLSAFLIAVCVLIYRFAKDKSTDIKTERAIAWTMAIDFSLGVVKELIFRLCAGVWCAILSCTAAASSYPYHRDTDRNEEKKEYALDWEAA